MTSFEAISTPEEIVSIKIEGMTCEHCVKAVAKALSAIDGITVQSVSLEDGVAKVSVQEGFDTEKLRNAVTEQGYKVVNMLNKLLEQIQMMSVTKSQRRIGRISTLFFAISVGTYLLLAAFFAHSMAIWLGPYWKILLK